MSFEQRPKCKICGEMHFAREPHQFAGSSWTSSALQADKAGSSPAVRSKSTAARKVVQSTDASDVLAGRSGDHLGGGNRANAGSNPVPWQEAGTQAPPVDTKKRGRPSTGFDRKAYQREAARQRRAKQKEKTP